MPVEDTDDPNYGDCLPESPASQVQVSAPPPKRQRIDDYGFSSPVLISNAPQRKFQVRENQETPVWAYLSLYTAGILLRFCFRIHRLNATDL